MNKNPEKFAIEYLIKNGHKLQEPNNNFARQVTDIAISALEKQIPKSIEKKVVGWKIDCFCPTCTLEVFNWQSHCFVCGQALNWGQ